MGLLDTLNSPAGMGLLSALAGGLAGARRGSPINNIGRGAVSGLMGYSNAQYQLRADEENAFAKQYKQMQMEQMQRSMADEAALRDSMKSLYKPAGTQPFQADNPFGEDLGNLQTATPPSFAGKQIDPVMAAALPYSKPADILKMFSPNVQDKTAEQRNWEFAQGLPEDQRAQFFARAGGGAAPATVQEWQYFSQLDPQAQARFLEMKRNPQIMNLGGSMAVRAPGGGVSEAYTVAPKITETPGYMAAQAQAEETAKAGVRQQADISTKQTKAATDSGSIDALVNEADKLLNDATGSTIGAGVAAAKQAFGISDKATQANARLKVIEGQLVGKVPRFEGPQSDADRMLYQQMAGRAADPTVPVEDRRAALKTMQKMARQAAGNGQAPKVKKYNPATGRIE